MEDESVRDRTCLLNSVVSKGTGDQDLLLPPSMENINTHYCFGGFAHQDSCDCKCGTCVSHREDLARRAFNKRLSQRIKEVFADSEFRLLLAKEILKK